MLKFLSRVLSIFGKTSTPVPQADPKTDQNNNAVNQKESNKVDHYLQMVFDLTGCKPPQVNYSGLYDGGYVTKKAIKWEQDVALNTLTLTAVVWTNSVKDLPTVKYPLSKMVNDLQTLWDSAVTLHEYFKEKTDSFFLGNDVIGLLGSKAPGEVFLEIAMGKHDAVLFYKDYHSMGSFFMNDAKLQVAHNFADLIRSDTPTQMSVVDLDVKYHLFDAHINNCYYVLANREINNERFKIAMSQKDDDPLFTLELTPGEKEHTLTVSVYLIAADQKIKVLDSQGKIDSKIQMETKEDYRYWVEIYSKLFDYLQCSTIKN